MTPTLLNTRPQGQTDSLNRALAHAGMDYVTAPMMAIAGLSLPDQAKSQLLAADKLVFVSRNAVEQLADSWAQQFGRKLAPDTDMKPGAVCFAIGAATQAALLAQGWPTASLQHNEFVSEALLARDDWQDLHGQNVLLIKGEGGREALLSGLQKAGADVAAWPLYRRTLPDYRPDVWQSIWQSWRDSTFPVLLVSSWQSFTHLQQLLTRWGNKNDQAWLFQQAAIVFSERIAQKLREQGWQGLCCHVRPQSQTGIIHALTQCASKKRQTS